MPRWIAKKSARHSMALATHSMALLRPQPAAQCRVLTYHRFAVTPRDPFAVTPAQFRQQMAWLARSGKAVSLADIKAFMAGRPLPRDAVLVTIDDGVRSVYEQALPILREFAIPAVVFASVSLIGAGRGGRAAVDEWPEAFMTWDELAALRDAGIAIGSHAWTHRSLGDRSLSEVADEVQRSKAELQQRLGLEVDTFAYPFGTRADYSDAIAAVLKRSGYALAFTSQHGSLSAQMDRLQLPRAKVEGGESLWMFRLLMTGALDSWRHIDRVLWRWQARHG